MISSELPVTDVLKGLSIPARPKILEDLQRELKRANPDVKAMSALIARDVGLSSAVLKTVNSPFFGLRSRIAAIPHAVQLLGAKNVTNIVTGLVLRATVGGGARLERFWDSAEKVACIATFIAGMLPRTNRDEAYTLGLFRDCGIPLLMERFPDYRDTLKLAAGDERTMPQLEDERHGTNHATVGYMVARMWELPPIIAQAIQRHHDTSIFANGEHESPALTTLIAINCLAEFMHDEILRLRNNAHWNKVGAPALAHLGFTASEYKDLQEEVAANWS